MRYFSVVLRVGVYNGRVSLMKWKRPLILIAASFGLFGSTPLPQNTTTPEYEAKALFLYNIAQFIEWRKDSLLTESAITIGVLGKDPFGSYLDEIVAGEKINGQPLNIKRYASASHVKTCHILFIHQALTPKLNNILKNLKGKGILTVSDAPKFVTQGGMVRFFMQDNQIKIRINLDAVKEENIIISSKLLRLAEIVTPKY